MILVYPEDRPARRVQRGGSIYLLEPGQRVDVAPADVGLLQSMGAHEPHAPPAPPRQPSLVELEELGVGELRKLARRRDVPGRSNMTRDELIEVLAQAPTEE